MGGVPLTVAGATYAWASPPKCERGGHLQKQLGDRLNSAAALAILGSDLHWGRAAARLRIVAALGCFFAALLDAGAAPSVLGATGHPLGAAGQFGRGLAACLVFNAAGQLLGTTVGFFLSSVRTGEDQAEEQPEAVAPFLPGAQAAEAGREVPPSPS